MKKMIIIFLILLILLFGLPILTGYTTIPSNLSPIDIGNFIGGTIKYWSIVFKTIFIKIS